MILKWVCIIAVLLAKYHFYIVYSFISNEEISPTYNLSKTRSRSLAGVSKEIEEPEGCSFIKCSQAFAIQQCPKTCSYVEPELCKDADCEKPGSLQFCPKTCANGKQNVKGCTLFGQAGDGLKRGSCNENFNCHADGSCKPTLSTNTQSCTVQGSNGDGINRGTCNEGQVCFRDGSCKVPEQLPLPRPTQLPLPRPPQLPLPRPPQLPPVPPLGDSDPDPCIDSTLQNVRNIKEMEVGGWNVDGVPDNNDNLPENCVSGFVTATFKGSGRGTLDFGNCIYTNGHTNMFLNDKMISIGVKEKSEVETFEYKRGDVLKIEGVYGGMIKINSFKLEGCE